MEIRFVNKNQKEQLPEQVKEAMDKVEKMTHPELSKEYHEMQAKYHDELKGIAEDAGPWEWSYMTDFLASYIRWMIEYYERGENVWGAPEDDHRLETLKKAIYYYDRWQNIEDEYIQVVDHPETYKEHDNGDGTVTVDDLGFHCVYKYGPKGTSKRARRRAMLITHKKLHKAEQKYKKLFFKTVCKYLESWWD